MTTTTCTIRYITIMLAIAGFLFLTASAYGEMGWTPSSIQSLSISSGTYNGNGTSYYEAYSTSIPISGVSWIQLHFSNTTLGQLSYIEITSTEDAATQRIDHQTLEEWTSTSAYFNGNEVTVKLFVAPFESNVHLEVDKAAVGNGANFDCFQGCFPADLPRGYDKRVGRIIADAVLENELVQVPYGTGFLAPNGNLVTAKHVMDYFENSCIIEFEVELSTPDGYITHPHPDHQYKVKMTDVRKSSSTGIGNDWCVFSTKKSNGLYPHERQNAYFQISNNPTASTVSVVGYYCMGLSNNDIDPTLMGVQRIGTGAFHGEIDDFLQYDAYTESGVSGAPVILEDNVTVIGIHTNSCDGGGLPYNMGTSFTNASLWEELAKVNISIDQKAIIEEAGQGMNLMEENNPTIGNLWYYRSSWPSSWVEFMPPKVYTFTPNVSVEHFLSDTNIYRHTLNEQDYKFHDWNQTEFVRHLEFEPDQTTTKYTSQLIETKDDVSISIGITDFPDLSGGTIEFKDPWLIDSNIEGLPGITNRGMDAPFKKRNSPFTPDITTPFDGNFYRGVFLDQFDPNNPNAPYYSVRAESTQIIGGFECVFDHWDATGANLVEVEANPEGYNQKAVVFTDEEAEVKAMYRMVQVSTQISMGSGWNMVSLPSGLLEDSTDEVFPDAISQAYTYSPLGGYLIKNPLKLGEGYWIKYGENKTETIIGGKLVLDTIPVHAGWNMIGALSVPIPKNKVQGDIITGPFEFNGGYTLVDTFRPGKAYWVKVGETGNVILDPTYEGGSSMYSGQYVMGGGSPPPFPPGASLLSPADEATNVALPCTLLWSPSPYFPAESSRVYWSNDNFEEDVHNSGFITDTSFVLTNLSPSTTYYWKVTISNAIEGNLYSVVNSFTTGTVPAAPTLVTPSNGATGIPLSTTLQWNTTATADSYRVQVDYDQNFTNPIFKNVSGLTDTSYALNELTYSTTYYWRVAGKDTWFGEGAFSQVRSFTTVAPPPPPTPSVLSGTSVVWHNHPRPKLYWTRVNYTNTYYLYRYICIDTTGDCASYSSVDTTLLYSGSDTSFLDTQPIVENEEPDSKTWYFVRTDSAGQSATSNKKSYLTMTDYWKTSSEETAIPHEFELYDNFPNPFNPVTTIKYALPEDAYIRLVISDMLGREIITLVNGIESAGYKTVSFDASSLPSGIYFYKLTAGSFTDMKKMILAK